MKTQAIIPSAGSGSRLKSETLKPFIELNGKPLLVYTLLAFEQCDLVDSVILVVPPDKMSDFEALVKRFNFSKVTRIAAGGETRRESVYKGLQVTDYDTDIVVVHDAARPLIDHDLLERSIKASFNEEALVVGVPLKPTVKRIDQTTWVVKETIDRHNLWEIQTPQIFKKAILQKAHAQKKNGEATDCAMLVEAIGVKVKVMEGSYRNIKVTTQEDIIVAEAFLTRKKVGS